MLLAHPRGHRTRRISLTPLIDIVFILLLFFILETNFLSLGELGLNLPRSESGTEARQLTLQIQVFSGGQLWLAGESLDLSALAAHLAQRGYPPDTPVLLSADDAVMVQQLVDVVDVLQSRQLTQVHILPLGE